MQIEDDILATVQKVFPEAHAEKKPAALIVTYREHHMMLMKYDYMQEANGVRTGRRVVHGIVDLILA